MKRFSTLAVVSALLGSASLFATAANAAVVNIAFSSETLADVPQNNNVFEDAAFTDSRYDISYDGSTRLRTGYLESAVSGAVNLQFYFLGSESGFDNRINVVNGAPSSHTEADFNNGTAGFGAHGLFDTPTITASQTVGLNNRLGFSFTHNADVLFDNDGTPPNPTTANPNTSSSVLFGYAQLVAGDPRALRIVSFATNLIFFALDDGGAGPDDNHEDYVGLLVTPIPSALLLFGPALAGLAWMRRRRGDSEERALAA